MLCLLDYLMILNKLLIMLQKIIILKAFIFVLISSIHLKKKHLIIYLLSLFSSTFCAGLDLSDMYERCSSGHRPTVKKFIFETLNRGLTAPLRCTKPVACSLDGHAIAGGIILALTCDYIAMGTRKPFKVGLTEVAVGVPFPRIPLEISRHQ